jgi:hypothetical protein
MLNRIFENDNSIEPIVDYIKSFKCKQIDVIHPINRSVRLEDEIIISMKDKFSSISDNLIDYYFNKLGQDCFIKLLTVESITLNEYKSLINADSYLGIIKYKKEHSPIYVNVYGNFKNEIIILKEIFNFAYSKFQIENGKVDNIIIESEEIIKLNEDYPTVLVSYSIEFDKENKGFVAISLPLSLL